MEKQSNKKMRMKALIIIISFSILLMSMVNSINSQNDELYIPSDYSDKPGADIYKQDLIGKWKAVSELVRYDEVNQNLEDYEIVFNEDNSYSSKTWGFEEKGKYEIEEDKITFYDSEGFSSYGFAEINNNQLKISFPAFPKQVLYEKEYKDVVCLSIYKPVCCKINNQLSTESSDCVCAFQKKGELSYIGECREEGSIEDNPPIYCILLAKESCPSGEEPSGYIGCKSICEKKEYPIACPAIAYSCPDGSIADKGPNCEKICSGKNAKDDPPIYCILLAKESCPSGEEARGYIGCKPVCGIKEYPIACPAIAYSCPDGSDAEKDANCNPICSGKNAKDDPPIYCILLAKESCPSGEEPSGYIGCKSVCKKKEQPVLCPEIYKPVCCEINGKLSTESSNCVCISQKKGELSYTGECKEEDTKDKVETPGACPEYSQPVCGSNGITYGNPCYAKLAGITQYTYGECREESNILPENPRVLCASWKGKLGIC